MPTVYRLQNTTSDLNPAGVEEFRKEISGTVATGSTLFTIGGLGSTIGYGFTAAGVPGASGVTGDYIFEFDCDTNANVRIEITPKRVNSSGTVQTTGTTKSGSTVGQGSYSWTAQSLGTWVSGDRLRFDLNFFNDDAGSQDVTIHYGRTTGEITVPWGGAAVPVFLHHLRQQGIS